MINTFSTRFRFVGAVSDFVLPWAAASPEGRSLCNHRRAYKFFTDSVSPKCHFPAFPCADYDTFLEVCFTVQLSNSCQLSKQTLQHWFEDDSLFSCVFIATTNAICYTALNTHLRNLNLSLISSFTHLETHLRLEII